MPRSLKITKTNKICDWSIGTYFGHEFNGTVPMLIIKCCVQYHFLRQVKIKSEEENNFFDESKGDDDDYMDEDYTGD